MHGWRRAAFLVAVAAAAVSLNGGAATRFQGTVRRGEPFRHKLRGGLIFGLDPTRENDPCQGWQIWIGPSEEVKTYASIATTPFRHGLIDTDICASDFRNSDNSGSNTGDVNRPQKIRQFRFVTSESDYQVLDQAHQAFERNTLTAEQVDSEVSRHVRPGTLKITSLSLRNLHTGTRPTIERMEFTVQLDLY